MIWYLKHVWKDSRITLKQLRPIIAQNTIEDPSALWLPMLKIKDGSGSLAELNERASQMTVRRDGSPLPDDDTKLSEGKILNKVPFYLSYKYCYWFISFEQGLYIYKTILTFSDSIYSGSDNPLILQTDYTITFACNFQLQIYPFDTQVCYLNFHLQRLTEDLGVLSQVNCWCLW